MSAYDTSWQTRSGESSETSDHTYFRVKERYITTSFPPGQTVTLNGMQMYYVLAGQGEPLVLLHGYTGSSKDWALFFDDLAKEYQLMIPDLLGQMTLQEKVALLAGTDGWYTAPVERLGIPSLGMTDGPNGAFTGRFFKHGDIGDIGDIGDNGDIGDKSRSTRAPCLGDR